MVDDGEVMLNISIAEATGLQRVCDPYCTATLQIDGPGADPWLMASPRRGQYKLQVTRTETAKRTNVPKWRNGVGRYTVKNASSSACFQLCLVANRLLGSEVLGRANVELVELLKEHRTDRWYSLKNKKNADAGSVRLVTVLDGDPPVQHSPSAALGEASGGSGGGSHGGVVAFFGYGNDNSGSSSGGGEPLPGDNTQRDALTPHAPAQQGVAPPPEPRRGGGIGKTGRVPRGVQRLSLQGQQAAGQPAGPNGMQLPGAGGGGAFQYKIGDMVGRGAFGKVFQAMNLETGELMAVKCVELHNVSQEELEEIKNEVNLLRTLRHRHVVSYVGTHSMENSFNILMEYCPGGSVSTLLKAFGAFEERVLRQYTRQCYEGLAYIHSHAVMHRDIKGANILVAANGVLKIADFGASAQLRGAVTEQNDTTSMRGTPFWMAPEVIRQERYGRNADCWSMGMTVIEMATANHPWAKATNKFSLMYEIASTDHLPDIPEALSPECRDFILKSINRNVEARMSAEQALVHPFIAGVTTRRPLDY